MEPVTHVLTGACLARTGLNRWTAYATAGMALAAEFPDVDTVWSLRGPISGFQHHRGITHTFVGLPVEAALILLGFFVYDRLRGKRNREKSPGAADRNAPGASPSPRWGALYGLLVLALLSHLLLDYTNNYGLRPFFPFNPHWYAASIVFIFDPLLFVLLVAGLTAPALFGWIGREIGERKRRFRGRGWAIAALTGVVLLWSVRWVAHESAVNLAQQQTLRQPADAASVSEAAVDGADNALGAPGEPSAPSAETVRPLLVAQRSLASPDPFSPFRWYTATDFGPAYRLGTADTRAHALVPGPILVKQPPSEALAAAQRSRLGGIYLDWSMMPLVSAATGTDQAAPSEDLPDPGLQTVTFRDLRFMGDMPFFPAHGPPPLSGEVILDARGRVLAQGMDGRFGR